MLTCNLNNLTEFRPHRKAESFTLSCPAGENQFISEHRRMQCDPFTGHKSATGIKRNVFGIKTGAKVKVIQKVLQVQDISFSNMFVKWQINRAPSETYLSTSCRQILQFHEQQIHYNLVVSLNIFLSLSSHQFILWYIFTGESPTFWNFYLSIARGSKPNVQSGI